MCLHVDEWSSSNWLFTDNNTSSFGEGLIDWSDTVIWALDFDEEDWFLESWLSREFGSIENSSAGWDDLTTTSMDGIGVEGNIMDVESNSSHVFFAKSTFFGGPLESSFNGILDFVKELDTLSDINEHVWSIGVWSEAPNLLGVGFVPSVFVTEDL